MQNKPYKIIKIVINYKNFIKTYNQKHIHTYTNTYIIHIQKHIHTYTKTHIHT